MNTIGKWFRLESLAFRRFIVANAIAMAWFIIWKSSSLIGGEYTPIVVPSLAGMATACLTFIATSYNNTRAQSPPPPPQ